MFSNKLISCPLHFPKPHYLLSAAALIIYSMNPCLPSLQNGNTYFITYCNYVLTIWQLWEAIYFAVNTKLKMYVIFYQTIELLMKWINFIQSQLIFNFMLCSYKVTGNLCEIKCFSFRHWKLKVTITEDFGFV